MKAAFNGTSGDVARITGGVLACGTGSERIDTVSSDSRDVTGDCLFVALRGERFDGNDFIPELCARGAVSAFISSREDLATGTPSGIAAIIVRDELEALGRLGAYRRNEVDPYVIGITGTNGKTTTKELVARVVSGRYPVLKSEKNYNNEIGVPFTLMGLDESKSHAVIEMGMNHTGEISRLTAMVRPDMGIITSIGEGHLEFLGSVENVALAKAEIMEGMAPGSILLLNRDTMCADRLISMARDRGIRVVTCGLADDSDIRPESYFLSTDGMEVLFRGTKFSVPLYGIHNLYNLLLALAAGDILDIAPADMSASLAGFEPVGGRGRIIDRGYLVIDDTYNSNPLSSLYALRSVRDIFPGRRKIAVLSDMKELGEAGPRCHFETGREVAANGFQMLLVWGELAGEYMAGAKSAGMNGSSTFCFASREELAAFLKDNVSDNDVILVKGSRSTHMENVVSALV